MSIFQPKIVALVIALSLSVPLSLSAQSDEDEEDGTDSDFGISVEPDGDTDEGDGPDNDAQADREATPATTETVVASIQSATEFCQRLQAKEYAIDCLAERLGEVKAQLEGQEGFEEVVEILATASVKLNRIARQNRSSTLAPVRFATQGQSPIITTRRLVPVDETKLDSALSQALLVIEEAETSLLRSAEKSSERALQFVQIAAAIGSNKVLLRSL